MQIRRYADARDFIDATEPWLLECEAENNLILGLTRSFLNIDHDFSEPAYLATYVEGSEIRGCAFRSPPYKLGLTRFDLEGIPLLVEDVAMLYKELPAVMGPEEAALAFARLWNQQTGSNYVMGTRQRILSMDKVQYMPADVSGTLRKATLDDKYLVLEWGQRFLEETGTEPFKLEERVMWMVEQGYLHLWEDGVPRSMASVSGETPNGVRIAFVYTPPEQRGKGYASAAVSALSRQLLDNGHRFCCLYTDLANPTSNRIYQRIGYEQVCDIVDVNFLPD